MINFSGICRLAALSVTAAFGVSVATATYAQDQAPINIVINQSPWLAGFAGLVDLYKSETGNQVTLDVNPYAGSLEKQRNAVRSAKSEYDILIVNGIFYPEMYHGGFLEPLKNIDPNFKLDPQIYTYDDTVCFDAVKKTVSCETGESKHHFDVLPQRPLRRKRPESARNMGRVDGQRQGVEQPA